MFWRSEGRFFEGLISAARARAWWSGFWFLIVENQVFDIWFLSLSQVEVIGHGPHSAMSYLVFGSKLWALGKSWRFLTIAQAADLCFWLWRFSVARPPFAIGLWGSLSLKSAHSTIVTVTATTTITTFSSTITIFSTSFSKLSRRVYIHAPLQSYLLTHTHLFAHFCICNNSRSHSLLSSFTYTCAGTLSLSIRA